MKDNIPDEAKKVTHLVVCGIKSMKPIFKIEILFFQSKTNLDKDILFGKITNHLDPVIRKMMVNGKFENEDSTFHSGP